MATAWDSAPRSAVSTKEAAPARGADAARKTDATAKTTTPSRSLITPGPKPQSPPLFDSRTCKTTRAAKKSSAVGPTPPRERLMFGPDRPASEAEHADWLAETRYFMDEDLDTRSLCVR